MVLVPFTRLAGDPVPREVTMSMQTGSVRSADESERSRQVDSVAWAVFFILIGAAMLAQIPWAWFLVALGVLVIGTQIVRWQLGLTVEAFWIGPWFRSC
jgi:hypothetical protein